MTLGPGVSEAFVSDAASEPPSAIRPRGRERAALKGDKATAPAVESCRSAGTPRSSLIFAAAGPHAGARVWFPCRPQAGLAKAGRFREGWSGAKGEMFPGVYLPIRPVPLASRERPSKFDYLMDLRDRAKLAAVGSTCRVSARNRDNFTDSSGAHVRRACAGRTLDQPRDHSVLGRRYRRTGRSGALAAGESSITSFTGGRMRVVRLHRAL